MRQPNSAAAKSASRSRRCRIGRHGPRSTGDDSGHALIVGRSGRPNAAIVIEDHHHTRLGSRLEAAIETLLADGRLVNRPPSDAERDTFGHGRHVKHVLDIGALGATPALRATRRLRTPSLCQQHNGKRGTKF
jgi:hypothetical protein